MSTKAKTEHDAMIRLFGKADGRHSPQPVLELLARRYPGVMVAIIEHARQRFEEAGGVEASAGTVAAIEHEARYFGLEAALFTELFEEGLVLKDGKTKETKVNPLVWAVRQMSSEARQWADRIGAPVGNIPNTVDVQTLWAEALSTSTDAETTEADAETSGTSGPNAETIETTTNPATEADFQEENRK